MMAQCSIIFISLAHVFFFSPCECNLAPVRALDPHHRQTPWASVTRASALPPGRSAANASLFFSCHRWQRDARHRRHRACGEAEARAEAIVVSGEMLKDLGGAFWNNGEWQVRVEDEAGNKVCALTFSADRRHLHEVALPPRP